MGVHKQIQEQRRGNGTKKNSGQKKWPNSLTYHPTVEEKETLRNTTPDLEKDLDTLSTWLDRGCVLSVGVRLDSGAYYATLREKTENWMTSPALSAWHSNPSQAVRGLVFALTTRFSEFPEITTKEEAFTDEW